MSDALDLVEAGADVGLVGPVGELEDGGVEFTGELGEAGVVGEPCFEELLVAGGEGNVGCRRSDVGRERAGLFLV
ncbi:MAG TPA: hypothetical protein VD997_07495 [Phycisphaerales bacterium]|nr:hypothetical protein [Phycisphaerales bacterium]